MGADVLNQNLRNPGLATLASQLCRDVGLSDGYAEGMETFLANAWEKPGVPLRLWAPDDPPNRYRSLNLPSIVVPGLRLASSGYCVRIRGVPGRASAYHPLPVLSSRIRRTTTACVFNEVIELRSEKFFDPTQAKKVSIALEYADSTETGQLRGNLERYNALMAGYEVAGGDASRHSTHLVRIFNNGTFSHGGRFYRASYQGLGRVERRNLLLDGKRLVELDFAAIHPTMLYLRSGVKVPKDPYSIAHIERSIVKRSLNVALNASDRAMTVRALVKNGDCSQPAVLRCLSQLDVHFKPIAHFFHTGVGLELQRDDSDIAALVMNEFVRLSKPILVVHDSFLVLPADETMLRETMVSSFRTVTGSAHLPAITRLPGSAPAVATNDHVMVEATAQPGPIQLDTSKDVCRR